MHANVTFLLDKVCCWQINNASSTSNLGCTFNKQVARKDAAWGYKAYGLEVTRLILFHHLPMFSLLGVSTMGTKPACSFVRD